MLASRIGDSPPTCDLLRKPMSEMPLGDRSIRLTILTCAGMCLTTIKDGKTPRPGFAFTGGDPNTGYALAHSLVREILARRRGARRSLSPPAPALMLFNPLAFSFPFLCA
jgi:hypothetical protein